MYGNEFEDFSYMLDGMDMELVAGIVAAVGFGLLFACVIGIVLYVFKSLGMYTIAKRRGINNPWLAWLPIGCEWIAGSISDQYQYVAKGKVTNHRIIMLVLAIAGIVVGWFESGASLAGFAQMMEAVMAEDMDALMAASGSTAVGGLIGLIGTGVSIASIVFWYISMYSLYSSCCPQNNVLFVVLSIFFGFLEPFFIFCNRNKDEGMPARTAQPEYEAAQPVQQFDYQPNRIEGDPWDNNPEN